MTWQTWLLLVCTAAIMAGQSASESDAAVCNHKNDAIDDASAGAKQLPFVARLHLIRRGETDANVNHIVLGQGDSPLTDDGLALAVRASQSDNFTRGFWRYYCSDLKRAHRSAKLVLGMEDAESNELNSKVDLIVDTRLREVAKGAREGHPKSFSLEEAVIARKKSGSDIPKLETLEEAFHRVEEWISSLIEEANKEYQSQTNCDARETEDRRIYDVFALTHSALIRTTIQKMVGSELPDDYTRTSEGSLAIPNLSKTIIDILPAFDAGQDIRWEARLVKLTECLD